MNRVDVDVFVSVKVEVVIRLDVQVARTLGKARLIADETDLVARVEPHDTTDVKPYARGRGRGSDSYVAGGVERVIARQTPR